MSISALNLAQPKLIDDPTTMEISATHRYAFLASVPNPRISGRRLRSEFLSNLVYAG
jgi:hypothetical protein